MLTTYKFLYSMNATNVFIGEVLMLKLLLCTMCFVVWTISTRNPESAVSLLSVVLALHIAFFKGEKGD